jgi:cell division protease FtsH
VVIGATNRPDILDPALLRPGRFDRHITVDLPDLPGRARILELHSGDKPISSEVDFEYFARRTPGFSGADLANVVNEAALLTIRQGRGEVMSGDIEEAIQRVISGATRRGRLLGVEERKRAAYHESGHVVVAAVLGRSTDVQRVSILGRGHVVGSARIDRETRQMLRTRRQLETQVMTLLGGVAAEELVFGDPSTGSEKDLENATDLARDMVARYGMSERLGRARLVAKNVDEFLDAEAALSAVSATTHQEVDEEIRRILGESEREASRILAQHRDSLDRLSIALETEESLEGAQLEELLATLSPNAELFGGLAAAPLNGQRAGTASAEVPVT